MSQYAQDMKHILASLHEPGDEQESTFPDEETEDQETLHVYPVEGGGILFTKTPLSRDEPEETIIDSHKPEHDTRPTTQKEPPYFLHFLLILCLFLFLDSANTALTALFTPTAIVTIVPKTNTISITTDIPETAIQAHVLPQLTVSQSQTAPATGKGHQDARKATGIVTFYNGTSTAQTVDAGTVFTGNDGVKITTDQTVTIPPGNPPTYGQAIVTAYALVPGSAGNIAAGDINTTVSIAVFAKNITPFTRGQVARDYAVVTKGDLQHVASTLSKQLVQSEQAAFTSQLTPDEALVTPTCTPTITSDHKPGDEATQVQVTVSETCSAVAYNQQVLQEVAAWQLSAKIERNYLTMGAIQVTVLAVSQGKATLRVHMTGIWVYQINEQQITSLIAGKPRLEAIHLLSTLPGIDKVTIAGVTDNQQLPEDSTHIHLFILHTIS